MNPIEWLRYKLRGVVWRIPVWVLVIIIVALLMVNLAVFVWQPWPRAAFFADIEYDIKPLGYDTTTGNYLMYIIVTGKVTNIGNANGTCSLKISVKETHGYLAEYSEVIDMGVMKPDDTYAVDWKYFLYSSNSPLDDRYNFEVTYVLFY